MIGTSSVNKHDIPLIAGAELNDARNAKTMAHDKA
jgi:hypothetical protein